MALNQVSIMGRLVKDPELRHTQTGTPVTSFSIAVDRDYAKEKEVDYIDIVAWRSTAEFAEKYFSKGRMVVVSGRLETRNWQDKDGKNRKSVEVVATNLYFGDSKRDTAQTPIDVEGDAPQDFTELDDDSDLPF